MTIPPALLESLAADTAPLPRALSPESAAEACRDGGDALGESAFRWGMAMDGATTDKLNAGLRAFAGDTEALIKVLRAHPGWSA